MTVQRSTLDHRIAEAAVSEGALILDNSKVKDIKFSAKRGLWQVYTIQQGGNNIDILSILSILSLFIHI